MDKNFYKQIVDFLEEEKYPEDRITIKDQKRWKTLCSKFFWKEDILWRWKGQNKAVRVLTEDQFYPLMYMFHDAPTAGHISAKKILPKLQERYYWPQMYIDVEKYVQACYECQMKKPPKRLNELHPIPPSTLFNRWGIDMVGPLPITQRGNKYIIVAVEYLSRWQEAKPVPEANAKETSEFLYSLICRYSRFDHLHSDRGTEFVNEVIQNLTEKFRIKHHRSTPYRPQANGLVERFNKTLCDSLVKLAEESAE